MLKEPKVYFFDTGLVVGDEGARFENTCTTLLLRHADYLQGSAGRFPKAGALLLVRHLRQTEQRGRVAIERAADGLARLASWRCDPPTPHLTNASHIAVNPPSTAKVLPVMKLASSLANHSTGQAISSGRAQRPNSDVLSRWVLSSSTATPRAAPRCT